jgi:predicted metal-dependent hydrolase
MNKKLPEFELKRSKRKTISLKITRDAKIVVSAPMYSKIDRIEAFVEKNLEWIESHMARRVRKNERECVSDEKKQELTELAKKVIPEKVEYYAKIMGVHPTGVKITRALSRYGSCSGKNSLCFSWRVMLYPERSIDYVVIHELSHIKHHDHSKSFWETVEKYMPDYREAEKAFKG